MQGVKESNDDLLPSWYSTVDFEEMESLRKREVDELSQSRTCLLHTGLPSETVLVLADFPQVSRLV